MEANHPEQPHAISLEEASAIAGEVRELIEAGKERLARETVRDATQQEVQALMRENLELNWVHEISRRSAETD